MLLRLGDSITTDHISPAGAISPETPAGKYLIDNGVERRLFNSYGSRRGNDRVMTRGTFANIRLKNQLVPGVEGGFTRHLPTGEKTSIYDAALQYSQDETSAPAPVVATAPADSAYIRSQDGVLAIAPEPGPRVDNSLLDPYLVNHNEYAASRGMQGMLPYVRIVGHELKRDARD